MLLNSPEKVSWKFRSFWISEKRTIQSKLPELLVGKSTRMEFQVRNAEQFWYTSQGCPLFPKFWKMLSFYLLKISGTFGRVKRTQGFPTLPRMFTVQFSQPRWCSTSFPGSLIIPVWWETLGTRLDSVILKYPGAGSRDNEIFSGESLLYRSWRKLSPENIASSRLAAPKSLRIRWHQTPFNDLC